MSLVDKLEVYAKNHLNVLLVGTHGIGKSTIVKSIADTLGLKFKYYSSSTLDPFADLVGIPTPDKETNSLKFYRPTDLEAAEMVFFDELNRAHPRVLNAVLEIVQFKTVNGTPLPNLKMVWAAMNPPGEDYQVEELDPALIDRFHQFVKLNAEINLKYLNTKMKPEVAKMLKDWWESLGDDQRRIFTPRRVEYLGMMISKEIPWRDCLPQGHPFPVEDLARRIRILNGEDDDFIVNRENILKNKQALLKRLTEDPKTAIPVSSAMQKFNEDDLFDCRDLVEALPKELVKNLGEKKFKTRRRLFKKLFLEAGIDPKLSYPKIHECYGFADDEATQP